MALVARRAREVAEAELALVLLYDEGSGSYTVEVADGAPSLLGGVLPAADVLAGDRPAVVEDLSVAADWPADRATGPGLVAGARRHCGTPCPLASSRT